MEIWKDIKGYEGYYQVSNLGNVKSLSRVDSIGRPLKEKSLKGSLDVFGYLCFDFRKNNKRKIFKVHQLVAVAFLGHKINGYKGLIVDHIDNDKLNNKLENLQLITARYNCSKDKKRKSSKYTGVCWEKRRCKWMSRIHIGGKTKFLGYFTNELEAAEAYQTALKNVNLTN